MNETRTGWLQLAKIMAFRMNVGRWLSVVAPLLAGAAVAVLLAGILLRGAGQPHAWENLLWIAAGLSTGAVVAAAVILRNKRFDIRDGLVRLELVLKLDNALTSAEEGRRAWPALPVRPDDRLRFRWSWILLRLSLVAAAVAGGFIFAITSESRAAVAIPAPRSHEEIAAAIANLESADIVREEDVEELKRQFDAIKAQQPENWYSHSSLEAADHLLNGISDQVRSLASNAEKAVRSLEALQNSSESLTAEDQQRLAQEFKSALQGLKSGTPGLNEKLMSALSKVDPSHLNSLDGKELEQMLKEMKSAAGACAKCAGGACKGGANGDAQDELEKLLSGGEPGDVPGRRPGDGPGRGGVQRGPGVAPLPLNQTPTDLGTEKPEPLLAEDLKRTNPGDAIGTADTEHELDKSPTGPSEGGATAKTGAGGEAVWRSALLPREKDVLKKYFK